MIGLFTTLAVLLGTYVFYLRNTDTEQDTTHTTIFDHIDRNASSKMDSVNTRTPFASLDSNIPHAQFS